MKLNQVLQKIKAGKIKYFEKIIDAYEGNVYGFIYSIVKDSSHTEDLVQETFIKVFRNIETYDEDKRFSTWLLTIARNLAYDHLRKNTKLRVVDSVDDVVRETPETEMLTREFNKNIDDMVQQLPEQQSQLIYMKYFEELSYNEIAIRLCIETKTVKWQLYDARKKLQKMMEKEEVIFWNAK